MEVGIMSMQRVENYGSFLQAYGLKKEIENGDMMFSLLTISRAIGCIIRRRAKKQLGK